MHVSGQQPRRITLPNGRGAVEWAGRVYGTETGFGRYLAASLVKAEVEDLADTDSTRTEK